MKTLAIDIETYSSEDLMKSGVYRYVQAPDFEILLMAYSLNGGPVKILDLASGESMPYDLLMALRDPYTLKTAHNANFERTCLTASLGMPMPPDQWSCTMAKAAQVGLPLSLDAVAKVLNLSQQKDSAGKALIRYFSIPCKPTKANGGRTRNLPQHDPEKWQKFKDYCAQDVVVEQAIRAKIEWFEVPSMEMDLWNLDQRINDRGVQADPVLIEAAIKMDLETREILTEKAVEITGLENPNSVAQLKTWLQEETGTQIATLNKKAVDEMLKDCVTQDAGSVLEIRQKLSKSSVKKYTAMSSCICKDGRIRGLLQYYGANRTGRWAGRLVQVQNLPRNEIKGLDVARELVREGDVELLEMLYGSPAPVLSQLIRTALVAKPGHSLIVADFAAIEARVLAWLADEKWRLKVFEHHGAIYESSASQMFKVPMGEIVRLDEKGYPLKDAEGKPVKGPRYELRQKGKVAELALGYQGAAGALMAMGALEMGLQEQELPQLVKMWRNANPNIVKYWYTVENSVTEAVISGEPQSLPHGMKAFMQKGTLFIQLPSGRKLSYLRAKSIRNHMGFEAIVYEGMDQTTKQWTRQDTYGGKLAENITQAIARDCLAVAMLHLDAAGFDIVVHVHDEPVIENQDNTLDLATAAVSKIMSAPIPWAPGLPLKAEAFATKFYKKD